MPDSASDLDEFLEAVDSGALSGQDIERDLDEFSEPTARRAAEVGIELLDLMSSMVPTKDGDDDDQSISSPSELRKSLAPSSGKSIRCKGIKIARYELIEELGRGGCGAVFRATDTLLDRVIALKVPTISVVADDESHQRFLNEGRLAAQLKHPNIISIYGAGSDAGVWYIASEYCSGPNLAQIISNPSLLERVDQVEKPYQLARAGRADESAVTPEPKALSSGLSAANIVASTPAANAVGSRSVDNDSKRQTIPPRLAAQIVADLADAVQHAHDAGVMHRDIKPANVMIEFSQRDLAVGTIGIIPKLTDFGLAKLIEQQDASLTATGVRVGTIAYMAPEQIDADSDLIGVGTDIYGLGNLLYELLTGQPPFGRSGDLDTLNAIRHRPPTRPRAINKALPSHLEAITMHCLEKEPEERFTSADQLANALRDWLSSDFSGTIGSGFFRSWPSRRRRQLRVALLATTSLLVVLLIAGAITYMPDSIRQSIADAAAPTVVRPDPLLDIRNQLVTYLPLTEDLQDASGNGIHAQIGGGDPEFTDVVGSAIELDGVGDFLTLDYPTQLRFGEETSFTVAGWFYLNGEQRQISDNDLVSGTVDVPLISSHQMNYRRPGFLAGRITAERTTDSGGWGLEVLSVAQLRVVASNGSYFRGSAHQEIRWSTWQFLCMIFDRETDEMKFWNNERKFDHFPIPRGSIDSFSDGHAINIGQDGTGNGKYSLTGRVRDIAIWRRALQDHEVGALREAGKESARGILTSDN